MSSKDLYKDSPYFKKFPVVDYKGNVALDLLKRVDINSQVQNFYNAFYAYTMNRDDRVEDIAFNYYDDVDYDWIIYMANDVVDPYYDVPLNSENFDRFLIKKYGTIETAQTKILYYKSNWAGDDTILSSSGYEALSTNFNPDGRNDTSVLPDAVGNPRKYWKAIENNAGVIGYQRNDVDIIVTTNRIETYTIENANGTFVEGERLLAVDDATLRANYKSSNTTNMIIDSIQGSFCSNADFSVRGYESGATVTIKAHSAGASEATINQLAALTVADNGPIITHVIPKVETQYFKPVTAFEHEEELNEKKRDIYLIEEGYKHDLNQQLKDILS